MWYCHDIAVSVQGIIHHVPYIPLLVGGLEPWNGLWLSIHLGMSSSQLTNSIIFQRSRYTTNQPLYCPYISMTCPWSSHIFPWKTLHIRPMPARECCQGITWRCATNIWPPCGWHGHGAGICARKDGGEETKSTWESMENYGNILEIYWNLWNIWKNQGNIWEYVGTEFATDWWFKQFVMEN